MKYNELDIVKEKKSKRVGRGIAAGQGKTAGRGTKGQKARTGSRKAPGFEGGQNPLMQRLPKLPGFTSKRAKAENVFTDQLEAFAGKAVTSETLAKAGLVSSPYVRIKLLSRGELTKKVDVKLVAASENAIVALQKAGGTFEKVEILARPASKRSKKEDPKKD